MSFTWCPGYFSESLADCLVDFIIRLGLVADLLFPCHLIASPNGLCDVSEISNVALNILKNKVETALSLRGKTHCRQTVTSATQLDIVLMR